MYGIERTVNEYGEELIDYIIDNLSSYINIEIGELGREEADCSTITNKLGKDYYELVISIIFKIIDDDEHLTDADQEAFENFGVSNVMRFLDTNPLDPNLKIKPIKWRRGSGFCQANPYWFIDEDTLTLVEDWEKANGVGLYMRLKVEEVEA